MTIDKIKITEWHDESKPLEHESNAIIDDESEVYNCIGAKVESCIHKDASRVVLLFNRKDFDEIPHYNFKEKGV